MLKEFEYDALRQIEDLRTTRERLGKPVFPNQKLAYKNILRSVSERFDRAFRDEGRKIKISLGRQVDSCRANGIQPNPTIITIQTSLSMIRDMQRLALLNSLSKEVGQSAKVAGVLDFIKGFQMVMNKLNLIYNPTAQPTAKEEMTHYPVREIGLLNKLDPKGLIVVKEEAKFWRNCQRISDGLIEPYEDPKLVADGAKLGANTFKNMIPFAEKVVSSGP